MYITEKHANIVYIFLSETFVVIRRTQARVLTKTSSKDIAHIHVMVSVDKNCRIQIQLFLYLLVGDFLNYFSHIPAYKYFSKSLSF